MKKILFLIIIIIFCIPIVNAEVLIDSNPIANGDNSYTIYPANYRGIGQLCNITNNYNITQITFYISKTGVPNALISVKIYKLPNYPSFNAPILSPNAVSNQINTTTLTSSLVLYNFTFTNTYFSNSSLCILFSYDTYVTLDSTNRINMRYDGTNPAHYGIGIEKDNANRIAFRDYADSVFYMYGNLVTISGFVFSGNATIQNVLKNQTFYSNSSELKTGNYTQEIVISEDNTDLIIISAIIGAICGFIMFSVLWKKK